MKKRKEDHLNLLEEPIKKAWNIRLIMQRIWKICFIVGIISLATEFIFLFVLLALTGDKEPDRYMYVWLLSSITCFVLSGIIAAIIYRKPYPNRDLYSELDSELDSELRSELYSELRSELYSELRSELYSELNSELRSELDKVFYI